MEDHGITLEISDEAKAHLVDKGYDKEYGARPMRRTIQRQVEDKLSEEILKGNISDNGKVKITLVDGQLDFRKNKRKTKEIHRGNPVDLHFVNLSPRRKPLS